MNEQPPQAPKRRKGCLFYGCLTLAILSLAVLVGGGLGLFFLYQKAEALVEKYASTEPMDLPKVQYTQMEEEQFEERLKIFADGLEQGKPTVPLVLKGDDLNMLLASSPDLKVFADGVRLKVEGEEIKGKMSLKLGDLGAPFFRDRYLNGEASFKVTLADGKLTVTPTAIQVGDKSIPEQDLSKLRELNLAEGVDRNPEVMKTLNKLEAIEVTNGVVKVVPKSAP